MFLVKMSVRLVAWMSAFTFLLSADVASAKETNSVMDLARQLNLAFVQVAEEASSSVVVIRVAHKPSHMDLDEEENPLWDMLPKQFREQLEEQRKKQRQEQSQSSQEPIFDGQGSGVVIREEGYILTNRHVVDGAEKIKVRFKDDPDWYDAEIWGVDSQSDVAVIKISPKGRKLAPAKLGDSAKTKVGEFAIAIGAPFELDYSVTFGHVSAKGRSMIIPDPKMDQDFIQTDASINPGNSGGPLVNIHGEVIGINTLIRGLRTGIGFAIPINLVKEVSERLVAEGKYVRSYLGIRIRSLKEYPEYRDIVQGLKDGVVVVEIPEDAPVHSSELKAGDVITGVDGKTVTTAQELRNEVRPKKIGQAVTLDVFRKGVTLKVKVKTGAWPEEAPALAKAAEPEDFAKALGLTVMPLTKELAEQFGIQKTTGVVITEVEQGSIAARKELRAGDIITEVNHKAVSSPKEFREVVKGADLKKGLLINYTSRGTSKFEVLKQTGE